MLDMVNISTILLISGLTLLTIGIASWSLRMIFRTMEFFLTKQTNHVKK